MALHFFLFGRIFRLITNNNKTITLSFAAFEHIFRRLALNSCLNVIDIPYSLLFESTVALEDGSITGVQNINKLVKIGQILSKIITDF